ncbi:biosynthetic arginine decarboxylase [Sulfurimonas sp. MAG313]|nr:biosynthetic arginine decarboxylase [Sulfurimonas sp. MAG313]MDF1882133.1 biosynthetic arginine decarboxylase [Sulfurimonas sp. MAG313]
MNNYGINIWADDNFIIEDAQVKLNYLSKPSLLDITKEVRSSGLKGPLILRFPHLIEKQIKTLFSSFKRSIKETSYKGSFFAVFPLKVNQFPELINSIITHGKAFNYGLEAGSKAELILAMARTSKDAPITVNGFKDQEMISLGFMAAQMGHNITLTIEGLAELETIIKVSKSCKLKIPSIGIRLRLHSTGSGVWAKSGGADSKFGLSATELLEAINLLKENDMLEHFHMVHFHIGSQMEDITPLKRALREAGNIYAELKKMGSTGLRSINIGGGLAVEYAQYQEDRLKTYTLEEFSNDVVFLLGEIMDKKGVEHPDIFTESGRFIVASHAVLITPVLELFSQDHQEKSLRIKDKNPPLVDELIDLNKTLNAKHSIEYLHDALDHMESLFTLFNLGYIDLQDRSNAEILVHVIIKKALLLHKNNQNNELQKLQAALQERYLINASIFQSLPDYWGINQHFPTIPLHKLDQPALLPASLWDITCDSDGEIGFSSKSPLYLHDVNLDEEEYFLGFFNVGAYQETLGMSHNLFAHPSECTIEIHQNGYKIKNINESQSLLKIMSGLGYDENQILIQLKNSLARSSFITEEEKSDTLQKLELYLYQNTYLRTTN